MLVTVLVDKEVDKEVVEVTTGLVSTSVLVVTTSEVLVSAPVIVLVIVSTLSSNVVVVNGILVVMVITLSLTPVDTTGFLVVVFSSWYEVVGLTIVVLMVLTAVDVTVFVWVTGTLIVLMEVEVVYPVL